VCEGDIDEFVLQIGLYEAGSLLADVNYGLEYVYLGIETCQQVAAEQTKG